MKLTSKGRYAVMALADMAKFDNINPGIVLIDLIIQRMINEKKEFFDFLKGYDRYKLDLGGLANQLYDIKILI